MTRDGTGGFLTLHFGWIEARAPSRRAGRAQAEEIIEDARAREREIRLGAEDYADDILNTLEINLQKFTAAVQRRPRPVAGSRRG